ncbi:polysaccharide deacetylase family protein [Thermodesulfobacteriota bacterium]
MLRDHLEPGDEILEDPGLYYYWPYLKRPKIEWPDGARIAFWVAPNVEFYEINPPKGPIQPSSLWREPPDLLNYGIRDYGNRSGFWRMLKLFDELDVRASISLSAAMCEHFPEIVKEMADRGWELFSHGIYNSRYLYGMSEEQEISVIEDIKQTIKRVSGQTLDGWLSPALTNTPRTIELLARCGLKYTLDLFHDDQPQPVRVKSGRFISLPYSLEVNDWTGLHTSRGTPAEYTAMIKAQFDRLYQEGAESGTVMCLPLHPWLIGAPHRVEQLAEAIAYILNHDGVWHATGREIATWYLDNYYDGVLELQEAFSGEWA